MLILSIVFLLTNRINKNHFSSIMLYQKVESGEKSREKGWNSDKHFKYDVEPISLIIKYNV